VNARTSMILDILSGVGTSTGTDWYPVIRKKLVNSKLSIRIFPHVESTFVAIVVLMPVS
jgi:hypothetical protein